MTQSASKNGGTIPRYLAILVAAVLGLSLFPATAFAAHNPANEDPCDGAPVAGVSDRDEARATHRENIDCVLFRSIGVGTSGSEYSPLDNVTRASMATFIYNTLDNAGYGAELPDTAGPNEFDDIGGSPHAGSINALERAGIVRGIDDDTYAPGQPIKRDQMASFMVQAANWAVGTEDDGARVDDHPVEGDGVPRFTDVPASNVHKGNIEAGADEGLFSGTTATTFRPGLDVLRDQMATFLTRLLQYIFNPGTAPTPTEVTVTSNTVQEGGTVTGTIAGADSATVSGCGFTDEVVTDTDTDDANEEIAFELTLPASQEAGECTLTFTIVRPNGQTVTRTVAITVEGISSNQDFPVTPSEEAINTISTTTGTNENRGQRTYTANVGNVTAVDIALIPAENVMVDSNGVITFLDDDTDANRADDLGDTDAVIETVNGVGVTNSDYQNNVAPSGGNVTFTVDSTNENANVIPVVFIDADNNNNLNLDATNSPIEAEVFGIGGAKLWTGTEAAFGTFLAEEVVIARQDQNFFTSDDNRFNYDEQDTFTYSSGQGGATNITFAQFEEWLSGRTTNLNGAVPGDFLDINYNPSGVSVFDFEIDVPLPPTGVTATVVNSDPGVDSDSDDIQVTWTAPTTPDTDDGYDIYRRRVNADGTFGPWGFRGSVADGTTTFNDTSQSPNTGTDTWQYAVLALNENGEESPNSNFAQVAIGALAFSERPISVETVFDQGPNQVPGGSPTQNDSDALDDDDSLDITFINVGSGLTLNNPSILVRDDDGTTTTLNSSNAQFSLGNVSTADGGTQTLSIVLTSDPTMQANGSDTNFDTNNLAAFISSTGISNPNGAWNLPVSGCNGDCNVGTYMRVFNDADNAENEDLPEAVDPDFITANPANEQITIDADAWLNSDIDDGETFFVYDALGNQIATGTFDDNADTTVTASPGFAPGDDLYLVYIDRDGTNFDRLVSDTTSIFNPGDTPEVADVQRGDDVANNVISVGWVDDDLPDPEGITQVSGPANYRVYDANNNTLIATGQATSPPQGGNTGGGCTICYIDVTLDNPLAPGTNYVLRVDANTVQDPNNTPNEAQTFDFNMDAPPNVQPGPPTMSDAFVEPNSDSIVTIWNEDVDCRDANFNTAQAFEFDDQSSQNADATADFIQQNDSDECELFFLVDLGPESFGILTYSQPAAAGDRVTDTQGSDAQSQTEDVDDVTVLVLDDASQGTGTNEADLTFSEPVVCATVQNTDFTVSVDGPNRTVTGHTCTPAGPNASDEEFTITFDGAAPANNAVVTVTLLDNTVTDESGLANDASSDSYTFVAAVDNTAPTVVGASGTGGSDDISVDWSEQVRRIGAYAGYQVFDNAGANCTGALVATGEGRTPDIGLADPVVVDLDANLVAATDYWVQVAAGTEEDAAGNPNALQCVAFSTP